MIYVLRHLYNQTKLENWLMFFKRVKSFVVHLVLSLYEHRTSEFGSLMEAKFIRARGFFLFFTCTMHDINFC